jgi:hypothetical protein
VLSAPEIKSPSFCQRLPRQSPGTKESLHAATCFRPWSIAPTAGFCICYIRMQRLMVNAAEKFKLGFQASDRKHCEWTSKLGGAPRCLTRPYIRSHRRMLVVIEHLRPAIYLLRVTFVAPPTASEEPSSPFGQRQRIFLFDVERVTRSNGSRSDMLAGVRARTCL